MSLIFYNHYVKSLSTLSLQITQKDGNNNDLEGQFQTLYGTQIV